MTSEIKRIRLAKTKERVMITLGNPLIERLASELNHLIEDKLEAESEAIRTEKVLSEMITGMSHDLRTPLTAIIGYLQLLEKSTNKADKVHYLAVIQARANQLHALIQSFFALSTIHESKETLDLGPIKIDELIRQGALNYYDAFEENSKTVEIVVPEMKSTIIGNEIACNRIIENILLNAMQYGGKSISLHLLENKDVVLVTVQNTMNSPEEIDVDRLFDRLYTTDNSRQTHGGLGLPIVQELMTQMEGRVSIKIDKKTFSITCEWRKLAAVK